MQKILLTCAAINPFTGILILTYLRLQVLPIFSFSRCALSCDIAAAAFSSHAIAHRGVGFARDDFAAYCELERYLEQKSR